MRRPTPARSILAASLLLASAIAAQDPSYTVIGPGCPGSAGTPTLSAPGQLPRVAETFTAQLTNVPDFGFAVGITGLSSTTWGVLQLPADLTIVGMPGCLLFTDVRRQQALSINQGSADWDLILPSGPEWQGMTFYQQAFVLDDTVPGLGGVMSDAAEGLIGISLTEAPEVVVVFPPPSTTTENDYVIVRGTAADPDGVAEVRVNGMPAVSSDGFANWQLTVPLAGGPNSLNIEARDLLGYPSVDADPAVVTSKPTFGGSIAIDSTKNRLLVSGVGLIGIDLASGHRTKLAESSGGSFAVTPDGNTALWAGGFLVSSLHLITKNWSLLANIWPLNQYITTIAANNSHAFFLSNDEVGYGNGLLWRVNLNGTDLRIINDSQVPPGPTLDNPNGVVLDGSRVLVTDSEDWLQRIAGEVISIDLATGNRTLLSGGVVPNEETIRGSGPNLTRPVGIAIEAGRALVMDYGLEALLSIDLTTGDRTVVSDASTGSGPGLQGFWGLAAEPGRALVSSGGLGEVLSIDLMNGDRTVFSPDRIGGGTPLMDPTAVVRVDDHIFVRDAAADFVVEIDSATSDRILISGSARGTGPSFSGDGAMVWDGSQLLIADSTSNTILGIDPATGNRVVVSGAGVGVGPGFSTLGDFDLDGSDLLVLDQGLGLLRVNITDGDRTIVWGGNPDFSSSVLSLGSRAIVSGDQYLYSVDLATGVRTGFSGLGSLGWYFERILDLAGDESAIYVLDERRGLFSVDPVTGNRLVLYGMSANAMYVAQGVALFSPNQDGSVFALDIVTGEVVVVTR